MAAEVVAMIDQSAALRFLDLPRLAVVGASDDPRKFGNTIYRELRKRGRDAVAVNPNVSSIDGEPCYPDLGSLPEPVDGVVVMVGRDHSAEVVQSCADHGIKKVWLFKGLGGPGAVSDEALAICRDNGIGVVAGACPLMFLEPVGSVHRVHRALRRLNRSLVGSSQEVPA